MRRMWVVAAAVAAAVATAGTVRIATASVFCKKKSSVVTARDACKPKETQINPADFNIVGPAGATGATGVTGVTGPAGPSQLLAFAHVQISDDTILGFGGAGTTGVTSSGTQVTFTGNYPAGITADKLVVLMTAQSGAYAVGNAAINSATPTEIVVYVGTWTSSDLSNYNANSRYVAVMLGQ